tara:strand:- start:851 stop:1063 length:213 start_codon:yes stop_codon:yes gene_type:complete
MEPFISIRIKRKTAKKFQEFSKKNFKTHSETMEAMLNFFEYNGVSPKEELGDGTVLIHDRFIFGTILYTK